VQFHWNKSESDTSPSFGTKVVIVLSKQTKGEQGERTRAQGGTLRNCHFKAAGTFHVPSAIQKPLVFEATAEEELHATFRRSTGRLAPLRYSSPVLGRQNLSESRKTEKAKNFSPSASITTNRS
jgi:hypothetical protein